MHSGFLLFFPNNELGAGKEASAFFQDSSLLTILTIFFCEQNTLVLEQNVLKNAQKSVIM